MGENIYKWCDRQGVNIQNIKSSSFNSVSPQTSNSIKKKKMGRDLNRRFSKEDIQMVEKMLNIANN